MILYVLLKNDNANFYSPRRQNQFGSFLKINIFQFIMLLCFPFNGREKCFITMELRIRFLIKLY